MLLNNYIAIKHITLVEEGGSTTLRHRMEVWDDYHVGIEIDV